MNAGLRLAADAEAASGLLARIRSTVNGRWDPHRIVGVVTAASTSELFIPYSVPLFLRQAAVNGRKVDLFLGLNNGYECDDVLAGYSTIPDAELIHLSTGEKPDYGIPGEAYLSDGGEFCISSPAARHRIFVVHQRPGPWSAGKTLIQLDIFAAMLAAIDRGWMPPMHTVLFDAESLFFASYDDPFLAGDLSYTTGLLHQTGGDIAKVIALLLDNCTATSGKPVPSSSSSWDFKSDGLGLLLSELETECLEVLGATTRFCAFEHSARFRGVPVLMASPSLEISGMHAIYNLACGLVSGCHCLPGGGTIGRTDVITAGMNTVLRRYPTIYGEDAIFTVLCQQLDVRWRLSRAVSITNRCPPVGQMSTADPNREEWKTQFVKWFRGFDEVDRLYGRDAARMVLGPDEAAFRAVSLAWFRSRLRETEDVGASLAGLTKFLGCYSAQDEIRSLAKAQTGAAK